MGKPAGFKGVIKPVKWGLNFVIVPREFAQDMTISPFTKAVLLDVQSRSEDWETNSSTIMQNYKVGRNKARSVLSEGMRAGYVYAHHSRDARERILPITYHFSTCRRTLREFVVGNGWETEESYALKIQALGEEEGPGTEKQGPGFPGPGDETQRKERIDEKREDEKEAASGLSHSEPEQEKAVESHTSSFDAFFSARKGGKAAAREKIQVPGGDADFDAFLSDYKKGAPGAPAGGEASARARFYKLSPDERHQLRASMTAYFGALRKEKWRTPQSVSKFVFDGWRDFVPPAVDSAKEAADEPQNQIRCVAMDINENRHLLAKRWWGSPEDVPADIREKAMAHAIKEYLYEPSAA